jgi:cation-transporting ATPase I
VAPVTVRSARAGTRPVPGPGPRQRWHELDVPVALDLLGTSPAGLSADEQAARRARSTARVVRRPVGIARAAAEELANPLTPLLGIGAALSAAVGSATDAALVGGVVVVNAFVGAAQRVRTEQSLARLEAASDTPVRVRVAGAVEALPADRLVPGDVIELEAGDTVPADCRVIDATNLEVDESAITGESLPIAKGVEPTPGAPVAERASMLFEGSIVVTGQVVALAVAVGVDTEAGRSAAAVAEPPPSGVEQRLGALTRVTLPVTVAGGAAVTALGFLYRRPARAAVGSGVALTVAAVPEGLPVLATLAQVAASRRLASRNALVRNPRALEALGRVDQVCFDKTGTLTHGSISLARVSDGESVAPVADLGAAGRRVLAAALRASPVPNGSPLPHATDQAIVDGAAAAGVTEADGLATWVRTDELPFEASRAFHATLGATREGQSVVAVKGAPEVVLPRCTGWRRGDDGDEVVALDTAARRALEDHMVALGRCGLRVLAVAEVHGGDPDLDRDALAGVELLGFVGLADLVRPAAAAAVRDLEAAGVRVAMITGDHPSTAGAIAAELGLDDGRVLTGAELDLLSDDELDAVLPEVTVFARTSPVQKVRIVEAYQRSGRSVAMTGDGANDAAAIRLADAGIALGGRGTAAARSAADIVVVDDRIETIIDSIAEGRAMWDSVRDAVAILVGGNLGELGFILVGAAATGASPLNPRQLLLVNLLTDMAPALAIALREPPGRDPSVLLAAGPDRSLGAALTRQIAVRAGATAAGASVAWTLASVTGTPTRARTVGLVALVGTQRGQTLVIGRRSPLVIAATGVSVGVLVAVVQTPGLSQFFGCRPLGPVGWAIATTSAAGATGASVVVPWLAGRLGERVGERLGLDDPEALVSRVRSGGASALGDVRRRLPRPAGRPAGA